jgi:PadR family transcriptional regulator, regulatory protein PadR
MDTAKPSYEEDIDLLVSRRQWKRLLTAAFVLDSLSVKSNYGNKIEREIFERTKRNYRPNPNEMYPVLRFLEEHGLAKSEWDSPDKRSKRIYSITEKGRDAMPYMKKSVIDWAHTLRDLADTIEEQFGNECDKA